MTNSPVAEFAIVRRVDSEVRVFASLDMAGVSLAYARIAGIDAQIELLVNALETLSRERDEAWSRYEASLERVPASDGSGS